MSNASANNDMQTSSFDRSLFVVGVFAFVALTAAALLPEGETAETQASKAATQPSLDELLSADITRDSCLKLLGHAKASNDVLDAAVIRLSAVQDTSYSAELAALTVRIPLSDEVAAKNMVAMWLQAIAKEAQAADQLYELSHCGIPAAENIGWAVRSSIDHNLKLTIEQASRHDRVIAVFNGLTLLPRGNLPPEIYQSMKPFVRGQDGNSACQLAAIRVAGMLPYDHRAKVSDMTNLILGENDSCQQAAVRAFRNLPVEMVARSKQRFLLAKLLAELAQHTNTDPDTDPRIGTSELVSLCRRLIALLPAQDRQRPQSRIAELLGGELPGQ